MRRFFIAALLFATTVTLAGCGDYKRSKVYGTIKLNGKPLANSTVIFLTRDNMTYPADLKADGSYEVSGVPQGTVMVSIQQALPHVSPRADPDARSKGGAAKGVGESKDQDAARAAPPASSPATIANPLPAKYTDAKQSGLKFELNQAEQEWSIDLN